MRAQLPQSIAEGIGAVITIAVVIYIFYLLATTPNPMQHYFQGIIGDIILGLIIGFVIGIIILVLWLLSRNSGSTLI
jgi:membrane protein DedA with SNARE-associated domain